MARDRKKNKGQKASGTVGVRSRAVGVQMRRGRCMAMKERKEQRKRK